MCRSILKTYSSVMKIRSLLHWVESTTLKKSLISNLNIACTNGLFSSKPLLRVFCVYTVATRLEFNAEQD